MTNTYTSKDGRTIKKGDRVRVYRNLHRGCWSIQNEKGTHVLGYAMTIQLEDVTFHVNEKGRQRVLQEKKKNVHAKVYGTVVGFESGDEEKAAYYNPYKTEKFIDLDGNVLDACESVTMKENKIYYKGAK